MFDPARYNAGSNANFNTSEAKYDVIIIASAFYTYFYSFIYHERSIIMNNTKNTTHAVKLSSKKRQRLIDAANEVIQMLELFADKAEYSSADRYLLDKNFFPSMALSYEKQTIEHVEVVNVADCGILTVLSTEDNSLCILVNYQPIYKQVLPQKISNFLKEMANNVVPPDLRFSII